MSILPGTLRGPTYARLFKKGAALRLLGGTSGTIDLVSPAAPTSYTLTLPTALGASDKLIQVDSSGNMTLVDASSGGTPAGSGTEIQYRNAGAFGAVAGSSWDLTTLGLPKSSVISTTANQLTVGYDATYKITLDVSSAGVLTLAGYKPSGSNVAAGAAYLDVPVSTGNATPGSLLLRSTVAGSSGSVAQTLLDTLTVTNDSVAIGSGAYKLTITSNSATRIVSFSSDQYLYFYGVGSGAIRVWFGGSQYYDLGVTTAQFMHGSLRIGAGSSNMLSRSATDPILQNGATSTDPFWITGVAGIPGSINNARHALDVNLSLGGGGVPASGIVTGGNAGRLNVYLRAGAAGSGGAAAGSDGAFRVLDASGNILWATYQAGTSHLWDGAALREIKIGANGTGPGGVGRAIYLDNA